MTDPARTPLPDASARLFAVVAPDRTELWTGTDEDTAAAVHCAHPGATVLRMGSWGWTPHTLPRTTTAPDAREPV